MNKFDKKEFKCGCVFQLDNEDNMMGSKLCSKHDLEIEDRLDDTRIEMEEELLGELEQEEIDEVEQEEADKSE